MNTLSLLFLFYFLNQFFNMAFFTALPLVIVNQFKNPNYLASFVSVSTFLNIVSGLIWTRLNKRSLTLLIAINLITYLLASILLYYIITQPSNFIVLLISSAIIDEMLLASYYLLFNYIISESERVGKSLVLTVSKLDYYTRISSIASLILLLVANYFLRDYYFLLLYTSLVFSGIVAAIFTYAFWREIKRFLRGLVLEESITLLAYLDNVLNYVEEKAYEKLVFDYNMLRKVGYVLIPRATTLSFNLQGSITIIPKLRVVKAYLKYYLGVMIFVMGSGIMFPQLTYVFKKIYSFTNEGVILLNLVYNVLSYLAFTKVGDLISHHSYFVKSWLLRLVTTFLFLVVLLLGIKSKILAFCLLVGFLVSYSLSWSGFLNPVTSKLVERFGKIHKGYIDFFVNLGYFITSTFSGVVLSTYGFYANLLVALMLFTIGGMLIWKKIMLEL